MAITDTQKVDYLWKKVGYGRAKTDVNSVKGATNESIPSPLFTRGQNVWSQADLIPGVMPATSGGVVTVYPTTAPIECVPDTTATSNRTWKTQSIDWIPPEVGPTYLIKVYAHTSGQPGSAAASGTTLSAAETNEEWFFDYASGTLNFIGTNLPTEVAGNSIYISGAVYSGIKGVAVPGAGATFTTLNITDLATFTDTTDNVLGDSNTGAVQIDGGLGVDLNVTVGAGLSVIGDVTFDSNIFLGQTETVTISGPENIIIDPHPVGVGTTSGNVYIQGDLYVQGRNFQVDSTTVNIADKVIGIATTCTDDVLLDGAGIGIGTDGNRKTILYHNASTSLKSSENFNIASGKVYQIDQTERLSADTLSLGTGTTIHSPASNTLILGTNGEERARIISDGKIGIATTAPESLLDINGTLRVAGISTFNALVDINDGGQANTFKVEDLTNDRVVIAGTGGELEDDGNFTFTGTELTVGSATTGTVIRTDGTVNVSGISTFEDRVIFDSTNSIQIPVGTTADRDAVGTAVTGQIRYNTTNDTFEGYGPGGYWGSLGGVKDVDGDTFILAEDFPNNDDDRLVFYTSGSSRVAIDSTGKVGIGTTTNISADLDVVGTVLVSETTTSAEFVGGGSNLRNLSGTHLVSYASASDISHSALSIAGVSTYREVGILTGTYLTGSDILGFSIDCTPDGRTIVSGAVSDEVPGGNSNTGVVYVYDRSGNSFNVVGVLTGTYATNGDDNFGASVAISNDGKTIVVGADDDEYPGNQGASGVAYVFDRVGDTFTEVGILTGTYASNSSDSFGESVAISGDGRTIVVGAEYDEYPGAASSSGVVYVFDRVGNNFNQVGILTGSSAQNASDNFGNRVAIDDSGKVIVVGAVFADNPAVSDGTAYVFERVDNTFNEVGILTGSGAVRGLGSSLDISADGSTIAVGAYDASNSGAINDSFVYIFDRNPDGTYSETAKLDGSYASGNSTFGTSLAISADGNTLAISDYWDSHPDTSDAAGFVYVYKRQGDTFNEVAYLRGTYAVDFNDNFGFSVAISADGKHIFVGADLDEAPGVGGSSGVVYAFDEVRETYVYSGPTGNIGIGITNPASKLDINGTLNVSGVSTFSSDLDIDASIDISTNLDVHGQTDLDEVNISGITTFTNAQNNTLGNADTGAVQIDGGLGVNKNVTVGGGLSVTGDSFFVGMVTFASGADGNITIGNTNTDNVVFNADIDSNLIPDDDDTYDLGSSTQEWRDLYIDGTANIDSLVADTAAIGDLTNNRVVISGPSGELEDDGNFTFTGTELTVGSATTGTVIRTDGTLNVSGISTIESDTTIFGRLGIGITYPTSSLHLSGIGTTDSSIPDEGNRIRIGDYHWDDTYSTIHAKKISAEWWLEQNSPDGDGVDLVFYKSRGIPNAEEPVQVGDNLFRLTARAFKPDATGTGSTIHHGNDYSGDYAGQIVFDVDTINGNDVTSSIDIRNRNESRLIVKADGKIGIGSTQPTAKLDVDGTLNVTGISTFNIDVDVTESLTAKQVTADYYGEQHKSFVDIQVTSSASKTANHRYTGVGDNRSFLFDGDEAPYIQFVPGKTYRFDQKHSSNTNHRLKFYLESDRTTEYTTGVTHNGTPGSSNAYTQIVVTKQTPSVLYYQSENHDRIGNEVSVVNSFSLLEHNLGIGTVNALQALQVGTSENPFVVTSVGNVGIATTNPTADLDVVGLTELDNLNVSGISTLNTLGVTGITTTQNLKVVGLSTFNDNIRVSFADTSSAIGIGTTVFTPQEGYIVDIRGQVNIVGGLIVGGTDVGTEITSDTGSFASIGSTNLNITGIATFGPISTVDVKNGIGITGGDVSIGTAGTGFYYDDSVAKVGIGITTPQYKLDVDGDVHVTGFTRTARLTVGTGTSQYTFPDYDGLEGSFLRTDGDGNIDWFTNTTIRTVFNTTAGAGQTTFTTNYTPGLIDVFLNGVRLSSSDYTATNGLDVYLNTGTYAGDQVEIIKFNNDNVSSRPILDYWRGSELNNEIFNITDNVGIGTSVPTQLLDVAGDVRIRGGLYDVSNGAGSNQQVPVADGNGGWVWSEPPVVGVSTAGGSITNVQYHNAAGLIDGSTEFVFDYSSNQVGIGTTNPSTKLDVRGGVRLGNLSVSSAGVVNAISGIVTYYGDGSNLTLLNGSNIASGTISSERLSGTYDISITGSIAGTNVDTTDLTVSNSAQFGPAGSGTTFVKIDNAGNLNATGIATVGTLYVGSAGTIGITTILDEDTMASNSDTALATQQSIKAYVDTEIDALSLSVKDDQSGDALTVDLSSDTLIIEGTTDEIETVLTNIGGGSSDKKIKVGLPNNVTVTNIVTANAGFANTMTYSNTLIGAGSTTDQIILHSDLAANTYRSVEYSIQVTQGSNFHFTKLLALHDGSNAYLTEYGTVFNTSNLATFDVDVAGGAIRLLATAGAATTANYVVNFTTNKV